MTPKRNKILEVSRELFLEQWFDDTSMQNIIERSRSSKWWVYHYFRSKEEILEEIITTEVNPLYISIKEIAENKKLDPIEKLRLWIKSKSKFMKEKYPILKKISTQNKHLKIKHRATGKIREMTQEHIMTNIIEWINDWFFKMKNPEQAVRLILWTHEYIFNHGLEKIKTKDELEKYLETIDDVFDKIFIKLNYEEVLII